MTNAQPKDGEGAEALLAIAQIIDPIAFKSHASMLAYCLRTGDAPELAKRYADDTHGPDMEKALAKARAILALAPPATPVRGGGGGEGSSISQSGYDECSLASAGAEPSAAEALAILRARFKRLAEDERLDCGVRNFAALSIEMADAALEPRDPSNDSNSGA